MVAAVIVVEGSILFMRHLGHGGAYVVLPGGACESAEDLEVACRRKAAEEIRRAASEFGRQLHIDLRPQAIDVTPRSKITEHPYGGGGRYHYFLASGSDHPVLSGPALQPTIDPSRLIWRPYVWLSIEDMKSVRVQPSEAFEICVGALRK